MTIQTCTQKGNILYLKNQYYQLKGTTSQVYMKGSFLNSAKAYLSNQVSS